MRYEGNEDSAKETQSDTEIKPMEETYDVERKRRGEAERER